MTERLQLRPLIRLLAVFVFFISLGRPCHAASGRDGAAFLNIPVGAGPAALGSAYSALATNAYAPVWNPAGLAFLTAPEAAAQHLSFLESMNYEFASVVFPVNRAVGAFGFSAQYLGSGNIDAFDRAGNSIGTFSSEFGAYTVSYGHALYKDVAVGGSGRLIQGRISEATAQTFAGDLGALWRASDKIQLGATVTNIGPDLTFVSQGDALPMTYHLSGVFRPLSSWLVSAEGLSDRYGNVDGRVGLQWQPVPMLSLRTGYRTDTVKELSALAGFSAGLGLRWFGQEFAYAWVPYGELGDTQYFSLLLHFGVESSDQRRNLVMNQTIRRHQNEKPLEADEPEYLQMMQLLDRSEQLAEKP